MPKVYSFDVFDTLVTRKVGLPRHIFLLAGSQIADELDIDIKPQIFANARLLAEKELSDSDEPSKDIYAIYRFLADALRIAEDIRDRMLEIELETEFQNIIPIKRNVQNLVSLRNNGERIIYTSDMYLGEEILETLLTGLGIRKKGEKVFVSCDYGADKTSGRLFDIIIDELGIEKQDLHHFGNSKKSDIQGAKKAGITSTYLPEGNLNRYERLLVLSNTKHQLNTKEIIRYSKIAASSRFARLKRENENKQILDVSCSVAAPLIYSFVNHVLERAKEKRIYFLARDGYIMYQIAQRIIKYRNLDIDIRYLYISREVLVLAKFDDMDYDQYIDYIGEIFSEESLQSIFKKLKVSESSIARTGLTEEELGRKLIDIGNDELHEIFSVDEIHRDIKKESREKKRRLLGYFKAEGVLDKKEVAVADSGWKLTIHNLMADLLGQLDLPGPEGFYFGINETAYSALDRGIKHGFYWDLRKNEEALDDPKMIRIFEVFCSAPHGQTVDYKQNGQSIKPELNDRETGYLLDWGIRDMEQGILKTVDSLLELHDNDEVHSVEWRDRIVLRELVEHFWHNPSPKDIETWGKYPYTITHDGRDVSRLFVEKPFLSLFRYVLRRGKLPNTRLDHWPGAYIYSLKPVERAVIKNTIELKRLMASMRNRYLPF